MGNKNRRSDSGSRSASGSSIASVSSPTNPSFPASITDPGSAGKAIIDTGDKKDSIQESSKGVGDLSVQSPVLSVSPELRFKSYKTGTLITHNGEPAVTAVPDLNVILPPTKLRKNDKDTKLSGASPAFIPKIPTGPRNPNGSKYRPTSMNNSSGHRHSGSGNYEKVQNLLQDMRGTGNNQTRVSFTGYGRGYVQQAAPQHGSHFMGRAEHGNTSYDNNGYYNPSYGHSSYGGANYGHSGYDNTSYSSTDYGYSTPPHRHLYDSHSPSPLGMGMGMNASTSLRSVPDTAVIGHPPLALSVAPPNVPAKPPKVFLARGDQSKKDIVVTAAEAVRNAVQVTQRYLPNGMAYDSVNEIYDPKAYNFVEEFMSLTDDEKVEFLSKNTIEIMINIPDDYENPTPAEEMKSKVTTKVTIQANEKGKAVENDAKQYSFTTLTTTERTVIDTLNELGRSFCNYAKKVTITLVFPRCPLSTPLNSAIALAPSSGAPVDSATFKFLDTLAVYIDDKFTSLSSLTVLLRVPSNTRMPLSMPQLYYVLPFYDLAYTNWDIKYQPDNLTIQLKVHGWAVGMLDRERDRVVVKRIKKKEEEQRKIDEAVFVRKSEFQTPITFPLRGRQGQREKNDGAELGDMGGGGGEKGGMGRR
ncbi:hypothetical protein EG329_007967 [Mollisiaceae sp. DMI_Dod_QoI]|nr:hypothetical protein EG329_007967 [Helotiales sp. DMI_Dod_QoI]